MRAIYFALCAIIVGGTSCASMDKTANVAPGADQAAPAQIIAKAQAPLLDGMGGFDHPISTSDPWAQRYFNQGMTLASGFNHAEAIRSFKAAQRLDPNCAMCYWSETLSQRRAPATMEILKLSGGL